MIDTHIYTCCQLQPHTKSVAATYRVSCRHIKSPPCVSVCTCTPCSLERSASRRLRAAVTATAFLTTCFTLNGFSTCYTRCSQTKGSQLQLCIEPVAATHTVPLKKVPLKQIVCVRVRVCLCVCVCVSVCVCASLGVGQSTVAATYGSVACGCNKVTYGSILLGCNKVYICCNRAATDSTYGDN